MELQSDCATNKKMLHSKGILPSSSLAIPAQTSRRKFRLATCLWGPFRWPSRYGSGIVEKLEPEQTLLLLSRYFNDMSDVSLACRLLLAHIRTHAWHAIDA